MRSASLVLAAYVLCVIVAASWRMFGGVLHDAVPDLGALTAAYLGLTARRDVAPAVGASVVLGYLIDLISGAPPGLSALVLALTGLVARAVQQRIFVRGKVMTMAFSAFVALVAWLIAFVVRVLYHASRADLVLELRHAALVVIATALAGNLVWRVFRRIDAAFARTARERDAALEGLAP